MGIIDRRDISFEAPSILAALGAQPEAAAALGLPAAAPDAVRFQPDQHRILVIYQVGAETADFSVPMESLGALLVGYCCRHGIALPRGAEKSIRIDPEAAVLSLVLRLPTFRAKAP